MIDRNEYLSQLDPKPGTEPITNTNIPRIKKYTGDRLHWKVKAVFHLSPQQNGGNHHLHVDLMDRNGKILQPPMQAKIGFSWEGMRNEERPNPVAFEKPPPEPAGNIPIFKGQNLIAWVEGPLDTEQVENLRTDMPAKPGDPPGNSTFHNSYYVVWQEVPMGSVPPEPGEPPPTDTPGSPFPIPPSEMSDPPNLFAIHDPGMEDYIRWAGRRGYIVFTEEVGADPNDRNGKDFSIWAKNGITAIVRLNYGYAPRGTIPPSNLYSNFAKRCANYVQASRGASLWIIGNEMNYALERPGGEGGGEVITPYLYSECFRKVREAILAVQQDARVIVGAVAPWNAQTTYQGNERGDWVKYLADIISLLQDQYDGVALHTYTHGVDPGLIESEVKMNPPFQDRYYNFLAYRDFCGVIPAEKPVFITETDENVPWLDQNTGWVQRAYAEIDRWNKTKIPQIYCLALYRWPKADQWYIDGKANVIRDFQMTLAHNYQPGPIVHPPAPNPEGDKGSVLAPTYLRRTPGYLNKPANNILALMSIGSNVKVLYGPQAMDGLKWWQVLYNTTTGWMAETDPYGVKLLQVGGKEAPNTEALDIAALAAQYHLPLNVVNAVLKIESGGRAFGPDDRLIIRFEAHIFENYLNNPTQFAEYFRYGQPRWTGQQWRRRQDSPWRDIHVGQQQDEWDVFDFAQKEINQQAARMSISMGMAQIMGFNYQGCGYGSVDDMYAAFAESAQAQLVGFFAYLQYSQALMKLQQADYLGFAAMYNGPGQAPYYANLIEGAL